MAEPDIAHKLTDEELAALEKQIEEVYRKAYKDISGTIDEYFKQFVKRDAEMKKLLEAGEITREHYTQWRLAQIGRGERFKALRDNIAERMTRANEVAIAYVNDRTPGIYSLNRNYTAYTIELVHPEADFVLWDEQTVKRLIVERPELMPHYPKDKAVKRGIDLDYGRRKITDIVTSGIMQGKGIGKMADDLQRDLTDMNRVSALRAARTAVTGAQNAGRQDGYEAAAQMGIKVRKRWIATKDGKTRHDHGMADGQIVDHDKPFEVGGYKLMFPGDPSGPPHEIYNCRCTEVTVDKEGLEAEQRMMRVRDPETGRNVLAPKMTYQEWAAAKQAENPEAWGLYMKKGRNLSADRKQYEEYRKILGGKIPGRFEDFQDLKYNKPEEWAAIKTLKLQTAVVKNAECVTTPRKYTEFFLKDGAKHAQDFFKAGYSADNPMQLRYDMAKQFDMSKAVDIKMRDDGKESFNIYMELGVTNAKIFRTSWIKDTPGSMPRIITAFRENKDDQRI